MREKNHQKSTSSDNEEQQDELDPSLAISAEPAPIDIVAFVCGHLTLQVTGVITPLGVI